MSEYLYTPDRKSALKHDKEPKEVLAYPICVKDPQTKVLKPTGALLFDDDDETVLEEGQTVGLPTVWYKVEVKR